MPRTVKRNLDDTDVMTGAASKKAKTASNGGTSRRSSGGGSHKSGDEPTVDLKNMPKGLNEDAQKAWIQSQEMAIKRTVLGKVIAKCKTTANGISNELVILSDYLNNYRIKGNYQGCLAKT